MQITPETAELVGQIKKFLRQVLKSDVDVDAEVVGLMITGTFFGGRTRRVYFLNEVGTLVEFTGKEATIFMREIFGDVVDREQIMKLAAASSNEEKGAAKLTGLCIGRARGMVLAGAA